MNPELGLLVGIPSGLKSRLLRRNILSGIRTGKPPETDPNLGKLVV
jgi:hypothetical protein